MKISEIFNLNKSQYELDFVDIDVEKDYPLFLDPFFISTRTDPWSVNTDRVIKSFFQFAIDLIKSGKVKEARNIFIHLNEPNETCLGISKGEPRGNGVGEDNANHIFDSIVSSKAIESGLVEDLQDSAIFIEGIGRDKISDATTNIIRRNLIKYTKDQCLLLGIPLTSNIASGFFWDQQSRRWDQYYAERLVIEKKPILLVPKITVTFYREYVDNQYYQHYILNYLQEEHLSKRSFLVKYRVAKKRSLPEPYVTKKDIKEKDSPFSKQLLRDFTSKHPDVFDNFKNTKQKVVKPIKNEDITSVTLAEIVEYLKNKLKTTPTGGDDAQKYHKLMIGILELIFYPKLVNPIKEKEINEGRKRIDIVFDNSAPNGFFYQLHKTKEIVSNYIFIECKNYAEDPKNPELDQLSGRMGVNTSKFGILVCRSVNDIELMIKRCSDLWIQKKELIIVLSDADIIKMLNNLLDISINIENILFQRQMGIILS